MDKRIQEARRIGRQRLADIEKQFAEIAAEYRHKLAQGFPAAVLDKLAADHAKLKQEAEEIRRVLTLPQSAQKTR